MLVGGLGTGLAPPGAAAGLGHPLRGRADRLGALAQVVQVLLHPQQVRMNGWRRGCGSVDSGRGAGGSRAIRRGRAPGRAGTAGTAGPPDRRAAGAGGRRRPVARRRVGRGGQCAGHRGADQRGRRDQGRFGGSARTGETRPAGQPRWTSETRPADPTGSNGPPHPPPGRRTRTGCPLLTAAPRTRACRRTRQSRQAAGRRLPAGGLAPSRPAAAPRACAR